MAREETDALEAAVLSRAHIVFTTMSSAAGQRLAALEGGFETAVFDEAAQAGELPTLIPLQYNVHLAVLVGDPQQLPATILSQRAKRGGLGRSLFERLQQAGHPTLVLRTQYRMHPAIRRFPSAHFYGGVLRDGGTVARACRAARRRRRIAGVRRRGAARASPRSVLLLQPTRRAAATTATRTRAGRGVAVLPSGGAAAEKPGAVPPTRSRRDGGEARGVRARLQPRPRELRGALSAASPC